MEATLDPQGKIHFTEELAFLRQNRLPDAMRLKAEQIEAQIQTERNAWDSGGGASRQLTAELVDHLSLRHPDNATLSELVQNKVDPIVNTTIWRK